MMSWVFSDEPPVTAVPSVLLIGRHGVFKLLFGGLVGTSNSPLDGVEHESTLHHIFNMGVLVFQDLLLVWLLGRYLSDFIGHVLSLGGVIDAILKTEVPACDCLVFNLPSVVVLLLHPDLFLHAIRSLNRFYKFRLMCFFAEIHSKN